MAERVENRCQIVISGVGGQGVLFITRLLAEAAIQLNLPVFTSETHGMAQRGGTVMSHLKVGGFSSPLIRPGEADGLIALKAEGLEQHGGYVKPGGWAAVNTDASKAQNTGLSCGYIDADELAQKVGDPKSLNLIMLGFTLSEYFATRIGRQPMYCAYTDVLNVLNMRLAASRPLRDRAIRSFEAGRDTGGRG